MACRLSSRGPGQSEKLLRNAIGHFAGRDRTAGVGAVTGRSNESAFRHPDTVAPIRSMIESEAAIHPPTFRVCEGGIIRCRQAWCVKSGSRRCGVPAAESQSAGAGDAAQPALMSAQVTPAASRAMPGKTWPATLARTGLADRRKLPPTARAGPPLARANPPCRQAMGAVGRSTGFDVSLQSVLDPCLRRERSWRYECGEGTPLPAPGACGPCPPRAHRLWQ